MNGDLGALRYAQRAYRAESHSDAGRLLACRSDLTAGPGGTVVVGRCRGRDSWWSALTGHADREAADDVDCAVVKCVALTFDDGPSPYTDRLLQILKDNDAKATFFLIGNKVAANPAGAKRIADAGMEIGSHTWEHPNMTTIPPEDIPAQFSKASDAIEAATGQRPKLVRTAGG